ncbi:ABC transporter substrate-binding protein [Vreelandella aquamarina]|jgi:peptide/nickel transport system substrate-binding protein|uniref:Peptide/nickel transport system substrate-binding protein n=1 Tax=Vreelandella aquamarina TaxID=77097 RepID=A0A1N6DBF0_9GAMM|nr:MULTISPECIES: ABC transporter substrate-binding protein [Halomonas]HAO00817.1 ABC transporter substrate-binding protein [Halomonas sp.]MCC4288760.1 ABC transporter substrate-binding protein [Halomonas meridiana]SIN60757.1 peptide/nickel transport system substrate-binding protein [Halomonas meridiana]SIN68125.1 peptide/nickel transport system substrate-binding protein [Halomonas meridiana]SIO30006.1 peptide/nickel transport system substrate-binding protein [Halomonas meridiana]|tara:strand:+ start:390 stop:1943 length:1554 start_codon:yes stop_codon:yes gene_type:complete
MKKALTLAIAAASMTAASAWAQEPRSGGVIDTIIQPEPPGIVAGVHQNAPTQTVSGNIFESLLRYDTDLNPMPQLAHDWTVSEDGLIYTFHLQEDATWHDGEPFTSEDVVFSTDVYLREMNPRTRTILSHVESIEAPDDHTVVFTLKNPFGPFLLAFEAGTMPMMPKHIYEGTDFRTNEANNNPIGTGPFKFESWERGRVIQLIKNEDYYEEGLPYLDGINWHVIPDASSRAVAYENGTVDVLPANSVENFDIPRLSELDNTCLTEQGHEYFSPYAMLWINNREGPMVDKRFRQAVMYALDREFARDVLWNGLGKVPLSAFGSNASFQDDSLTPYDHNPERARELLDEMGYDGEEVRLLPIPYGETWVRWAEAVQQNLQEVGINVTTQSTDVGGWNQRLGEWDYDLAFTYLFQYGDPALGISRTYISSNIAKGSPWNNVQGYENERVDELFDLAATAYPDAQREEYYQEVQQILHEDVPVGWLLELGFPTIYSCDVKNLVTTGIGLNDGFKNAWLDR